MPGFTDYQSIAQAASTGKSTEFCWHKTLVTPQGAGAWYSLWTQTGTPTPGFNPSGTPGVTYTNAAGAISLPDVAPQQRHLFQVCVTVSSQFGSTLMLYDRLAGVGSVAINSSGNKTINSLALPRYVDGRNVQAWIEVPSALSVSTALTFRLSSYTNQDGVAGRATTSTISPPFTTLPAGSLIGPLPLQTGDLGIRSIEAGLNIGGTIPAAGTVNVVLLYPLAYLGYVSSPNERDEILMTTLFPRIFDGASLGLAFLSGSTSGGNIQGTISTVWG